MHPMTLYRARRVPFLFVGAGLKHSTIKRCAGPLVTLFLVHSFACQPARNQMRAAVPVGDRVTVSLSSGRVVDAVVKAVINRTDGVRLQVDYGKDETALVEGGCIGSDN